MLIYYLRFLVAVLLSIVAATSEEIYYIALRWSIHSLRPYVSTRLYLGTSNKIKPKYER